ncbi:MAG TPA: dihydrolipoyl dehydrogenase [Anaerolineaceae bacterium]|nr:dihydrolipoyl dehydrogenase [Anaerolineaceae bacterium]
MKEYDVIVIGAGPGGYVAAIRAAQLGFTTAIIEKRWLGGVCLNVGCIPSKALLKNAEVARTLREEAKDYGITGDNITIDYATAVKRSRRVSDRLTRGVGFLMKKNKIDVYEGFAFLKTKNTIHVDLNNGEKEELKTKNIIIATGAYPFIPPSWNHDGKKVLTYEDAILQEKLPASAIIIGAGAIGAEFATIWSSFGTKISIVEMLPNILPLEDEELSAELQKAFLKRGIQIFTGHKVEAIEPTGSGVKVTVSVNGEIKELEAEQALVAIGFKANTENLGLENADVELDKRGFIQVDQNMATNTPGIWAVGDVNGKLLLAHAASTMGIHCVETIKGIQRNPIDFNMIPSATYCYPQVASFGFTEKQAKEAGKEIKVGRFPFQANGKSLGLGESNGFVKVVVDAKYGEILGAHMIGPEVSELLPELTLAHNAELTIEEVAHNVHAHPTLSEVLMEAAEDALGHAIHI